MIGGLRLSRKVVFVQLSWVTIPKSWCMGLLWTGGYTADVRPDPFYCSDSLLTAKASPSVYQTNGITFGGLGAMDDWYFGPALDTDAIRDLDWNFEWPLSCHLDRAYHPFCLVAADPAQGWGEPGDGWRPSDCRWKKVYIEEDVQTIEYSTIIGLRFDGAVEAYSALEVAGEPLETLIPEGQYVDIRGLPEVVGCGLTVEGEIRCWDVEGILDQGVPVAP